MKVQNLWAKDMLFIAVLLSAVKMTLVKTLRMFFAPISLKCMIILMIGSSYTVSDTLWLFYHKKFCSRFFCFSLKTRIFCCEVYLNAPESVHIQINFWFFGFSFKNVLAAHTQTQTHTCVHLKFQHDKNSCKKTCQKINLIFLHKLTTSDWFYDSANNSTNEGLIQNDVTHLRRWGKGLCDKI